MSATCNQVLLFWRDSAGKEGTSFWTLQNQADDVPAALVALAAAVQACSNAKIYAVQYQTTHQIAGAPVFAAYPSVMDRAHLVGKIGATNVTTHYDLVAPKQTLFQTGNVVLDMGNASVIALVASMLTNIGDASGNPLTSILRGRRQWAGRNP